MSSYVVSREDDFDFRSSEYAELHAASEATLFQHPAWLDGVYRHRVRATDATPLVVTVREPGAGRLVAVLPLVHRRRRGFRFVEYADLGVSDYATAVIERRSAARVLTDPTIPDAVRAVLGRYDVLDVRGLRGSDRSPALLLGAPGVRRLPYDTHPVALPPSTEDWRAKLLDPSFARHLARKRKRLRPKGRLELRTVTDTDEVRATMETIRKFRAARFADRRAVDLMQDPDCFEFYCAVAQQGAVEGGPARLFALTLDGATVAATLDLVDDHEHVFLIVGYDFARLRNYSLGLLIVEELIDRAVAADRHTFDLTVGDEGYKADFGAASVPMYAVRSPASVRGHLATAAMALHERARQAAKKWLTRPQK